MTSQPRRAIALALAAVISAGVSACGVLVTAGGTAPPPRSATAQSAQKALSNSAIYARIAPTVVDVTSSLRYDGETADGTGFVINAAAALILTNNHVIRDATEVTVTLTSTGRQYRARIVGVNVLADVALLQLQGAAGPSGPPAPDLLAAPVGDSKAMAAGAPVLAIGNQAGAGGAPAVTAGVISGLGQTIQANDASSGFTETLHNMFQTSARIAPGDSGGPLANTAGQVIGMDTAAGSGTADRSGYAIPIDDALTAARLIAAGRPAPGVTIGPHGFLGVVLARPGGAHPSRTTPRATISPAPAPRPCTQTIAAAAASASVPSSRPGALVAGVLCGTGAATAGLAAGDVITSANGHRISSPGALTAIVSACRPGAVVTVTWISASGQPRARRVRLDTAPALLSGGYTPTPQAPHFHGLMSVPSGYAGGTPGNRWDPARLAGSLEAALAGSLRLAMPPPELATPPPELATPPPEVPGSRLTPPRDASARTRDASARSPWHPPHSASRRLRPNSRRLRPKSLAPASLRLRPTAHRPRLAGARCASRATSRCPSR